MHRSESRLPHSNSHTLISDILSRFSWVRVVFCFRDSARACAPSSPILLPRKIGGQLDLTVDMQTIDPPNSDIPLRFSWVRVVFCFRDSARACAPSGPILLSRKINKIS